MRRTEYFRYIIIIFHFAENNGFDILITIFHLFYSITGLKVNAVSEQSVTINIIKLIRFFGDSVNYIRRVKRRRYSHFKISCNVRC